MGFAAYAAELQGHVSKLPYTLAELQINRAWEAIRRKRLWSFLIREALVFFPAAISTGTVTVTFGSATVVGDAAAAAAWTLVLLGNPPLIQRQFRFGNILYNITAISTTTNPNDTLTLDMAIGAGSAAGASYSIYLAYVRAPSVDFKRWKSVVDPQQGFSIARHTSRQWLDIMDPTRGSSGQALRIADYKTDAADSHRPIFEWWPHQTAQTAIHAIYEVMGESFVASSDALPAAIPESILIDYALSYFAYPWAGANVGRYPELKGTSWLSLAVETKRRVAMDLLEVRRNDEEHCQQMITLFARRSGYPVDASFWQSHSTWDW